MAVQVGSISLPGSTGNFSDTSVPFEPVAVIFFNIYEHLAAPSWTLGCASSSSDQWCIWTGLATELSSYTNRMHEGRTDRCALQYVNGSNGTVAWACSLVSLNSNGFTLNLDTRNSVGGGTGADIYYMAIGGDYIHEAHAGTFTAGASTGTVGVTAPGFAPSALLMAHVMDAAFDAGATSQFRVGTGASDGANQYSSYVQGNTGTAVSVSHIHRTDAIACCYDGTNTFRMEHESFDSTGFTVDVTDAYTGDIEFGYLAVRADVASVGSSTQPTADGFVSYTTGFRPGGVFFFFPGVDVPSTSGSTTAPLRPGVAAVSDGVGRTRHSSGIFRSSVSAGVFNPDGYQINTSALGFWGVGNAVGGADNNHQAVTSATFEDETFTLNWDVIDTVGQRAWGWLALPGVVGLPQFYRRQPGAWYWDPTIQYGMVAGNIATYADLAAEYDTYADMN